MADNSFIGSWRLVSFEFRNADRQVIYPFGEDAKGYIMYSSDGYMSVAIMTADRPKFASEHPRESSIEERVEAFMTHFSYCGRYSVSDNKVIHHVEVSSFPNWKGENLERIYEFHGNRLTLSTPPTVVGGIQGIYHLTWERV